MIPPLCTQPSEHSLPRAARIRPGTHNLGQVTGSWSGLICSTPAGGHRRFFRPLAWQPPRTVPLRNPLPQAVSHLAEHCPIFSVMHQSIPAAPSPAPSHGYCGAFARLVSPGGGAFANFKLPGGRTFANPGANPELLTRTRAQFPIRI